MSVMEPIADSTPPDLLGALEAAEYLGLHRNHVNRLAAAGVIKTALKIPGKTGARLFAREELQRFAAENYRPLTAPVYDDLVTS